MKSITIDISDKVYAAFKSLLKRLPEGSFRIYENDSEVMTAEEEQAFYETRNDIEKGDWSDFEDWDDLKNKL